MVAEERVFNSTVVAEVNPQQASIAGVQDALQAQKPLLSDGHQVLHEDMPVPVEEAVREPVAVDVRVPVRVPVESDELIRWRLERGYPDESGIYEGYSEATLKTLADGGDIRALQTLADLYAANGDQSPEHQAMIGDLYRKAAVYGSTFAFVQLGRQKEAAFAALALDDPRRSATAREVLATYRAAALRGDKMPDLARARYFISHNQLQLSAEDQAAISQRAQEIYDHLTRQRYAQGLRDFDNATPAAVDSYLLGVESVLAQVEVRRKAGLIN